MNAADDYPAMLRMTEAGLNVGRALLEIDRLRARCEQLRDRVDELESMSRRDLCPFCIREMGL